MRTIIFIATTLTFVLACDECAMAYPIYLTTPNSVTVIDSTNLSIIAAIPIDVGPTGCCFGPIAVTSTGQVYVPRPQFPQSGNVAVVDTGIGTLVSNIPASAPIGIVISPDGSLVYVANVGSQSLQVLSAANHTQLFTIPLGTTPQGVAISSDGRRIYVSDPEGVAVIDTATNVVIARVPIPGSDIRELAVTPDMSRVYVTSVFAGIFVIDTASNTVMASIPDASLPVSVVISPDGRRAYVGNSGGDGVFVVDTSTNTVVADIGISGHQELAVSPDGTRLYVAVFLGALYVVDTSTNSIVSSVTPSGGPAFIALAHSAVTLDDDSALARLTGGNIFQGNQTIQGILTATSLSGDGSRLINLTPSNIGPGTAAINISGIAASALNANNSTSLGGVFAANYARLDIGNTFNGNQAVGGNLNTSGDLAVSGSLAIGGGTGIIGHISDTFDPSFPALKPGTCSSVSFTFPGVRDGDSVALGVPDSRMAGGGTLIYFVWISAADTINMRACNIDQNVRQRTPGTGPIRVDIWKH